MTFRELIRNSLLAESAAMRPPHSLMRIVLCAWRKLSHTCVSENNSTHTEPTAPKND